MEKSNLKWAVGDRVVYTKIPSDGDHTSIPYDSEVTIVQVDYNDVFIPYRVQSSDGVSLWSVASRLQPLRPLQVGDRVRVLTPSFYSRNQAGDVGRVVKKSSDDCYLVCPNNTKDTNSRWENRKNLELIKPKVPMDNELKITKEAVLKAASQCSTAKATLQTLFPQVFEPSKPVWTKLTEFPDVKKNGRRAMELAMSSVKDADIWISTDFELEEVPSTTIGGKYYRLTLVK